MLAKWAIPIKGFKDYLLLERAMSPNSIAAYERDISRLAEFLAIEDLDLSPQEITLEQLQHFTQYLNELGLSRRSQARILSGIRAFYKYLLVEDLIDQNPTELLEIPKLGMKIPEVLTVEEIQQLLGGIDLSHPQGHRNRAMLETLYASGLRVSELVNLRISQLFLDVGFIKVIGKNSKERLVPIGASAIKYILLYFESIRRLQKNVKPGEEDILFLNRRGKRLTRVMVFLVIKDLVKVAGIEKKVSPHTFRHSFATHLIEGGADLKAIQDMLGHESITTTEIYTHLDTDYLKETLLTFHPLNRKGEKGEGGREQGGILG